MCALYEIIATVRAVDAAFPANVSKQRFYGCDGLKVIDASVTDCDGPAR
jgi:hypothetical protein